MTQIDFYTHVANPFTFACKLVHTVWHKQERLLVWFSTETELLTFSQQLWCMGDTVFVPHCQPDAPEAAETPIWLTVQLAHSPTPPTLLNLTSTLPKSSASFSRILEIVGMEENALQLAREHYKTYRNLGYAIHHHNMEQCS